MAQPLEFLPTGAKVKFGRHQINAEEVLPIIWTIVAKNHTGYPSNSITLHATNIIDLRCFDGSEPGNTSADRRNYGNNRYGHSNIAQWLNSDAEAGEWYVSKHEYDTPPEAWTQWYGETEYADRPGFLNLFTEEEKDVILSTLVRTQLGYWDGDYLSSANEQVFLPSLREMGITSVFPDVPEGTSWGYYTNNNARRASLTPQAYNNTLSTFKPDTVGAYWTWLLRTYGYGDNPTQGNVSCITPSGSASTEYARMGNMGIRPALNLSSDVLVSDTTDSDGAYVTRFWTPPSISTKIDGVHRPYADGAVKIGGVWRTTDEVHTKINGVWRKS